LRLEPVSVAIDSDEVWIGVKSESNLVIAGSLRNAFRCSALGGICGVELWSVDLWTVSEGGSVKLRIRFVLWSSETLSEKVLRREGNSPEE
jgi:hypothetical protein